MARRLPLLAGVIALACVLLVPASAMAQRYASPTGSGVVCSENQPCSLGVAVNNALLGGEVIVLPGDYDIGATSLTLDDPTFDVHGADGQPRPTIHGAPNAAALVDISGIGTTMSHLSLRQDGTGGIPGLSVTVNSPVASILSDLMLTNTASGGTAARLATGVALRSSTAHATSGDGITAFGSAALHNVTAWGGDAGITADGLTTAVTAANTIARGSAGTDVVAVNALTTITLTSSNFATKSGNVVGVGQSDAPILANPADGDFHQLPGSPTINAGTLPVVDLTDIDGDARVIGSAPDIGADEFLSSPPAVTTGDPLAITTSGAQLTGTVNPKGQPTTYRFDYGLSPAYGSSTPAQSAGAGSSDVPVAADIGGLAPGSIVNYRLVASNADGETAGLNRTLVVLTDPPPLPPPPDLPQQPPPAPTQILPPVNLGGATGPAPTVTDIQLPSTVVVGQPITIEAEARDPDDPVNSIIIDFDDGPSVIALSACRLSPRSRVFDNNRTTDFEVPYTFMNPGTHNVEVTLGSGDCGRPRQTRTQTVQVNVAPAKTRAQRRLARGVAVIAGADCPGADVMPTRRTLRSMEKTTRCVLNATRRAGGLKALRHNSRLRKAAALHNTYMRRGKFFAHQGPREPSLAARLRRVKYRGGVGENLAAGSGAPLATPRGIVMGWMGSPLHRANVMERRYYTVGIAIMAEMPLDPFRPGATWTGEFGTTRR